MKLALAQLRVSPNKRDNLDKTLDCIRRAAASNADLIFFPEVQLTPFFPQYEKKDVSDCVIGMENEAIREVCCVCREEKIFASPNFYIEENGRRYDMSLLIDDAGTIVGRQKMVHIAQCEQFYEQDYYTPSEEGFAVFDTRLGRLGIVVCFDRHYPESIRTEALMGADLILIPTANTTGEPSELFQWEIKIQAFQNSVNVAMCNRIGREDGMEFSGESLVSDYNGKTLALAGAEETLLLCDVDLPAAAATRSKKPYTSLRRTDLYI